MIKDLVCPDPYNIENMQTMFSTQISFRYNLMWVCINFVKSNWNSVCVCKTKWVSLYTTKNQEPIYIWKQYMFSKLILKYKQILIGHKYK